MVQGRSGAAKSPSCIARMRPAAVRAGNDCRHPLAPLPFGQSDLLVALKKLRLGIAGQRHLPAYLIFSDKTLVEMARLAPRSLQEFAMVSGVGVSKLRDFGQVFVDAISAHIDHG